MRKVTLELPNQETKEYSDFNEYLVDFEKTEESIRHSWGNISGDTLRLHEAKLKLHTLVLKGNMKSKFNAPDIKKWQDSMDRLEKLAQENFILNPLVQEWTEKLYQAYESSDPKINKLGRMNFRIILKEAYDNDDSMIKQWDSKRFHWAIEIMDALKRLEKLNKLEEVIQKLN